MHQTVSYYGPRGEQEAKTLIAQTHRMAKRPLPMAADNDFSPKTIDKSEVILAPYDAKNIYMRQLSNNGQVFDVKLQPEIDLFNEYFGGGMNTIVFQELRESRGLAYSASAYYLTPNKKGQTNCFYTSIITQNDKMGDCLDVFNQITEQMPLDEGAFSLAKQSLLKRMATERTIKAGVLRYYQQCRDLGLTEDPQREEYKRIQAMTLDDLSLFHRQNVKGRTYTTLILGSEGELDLQKLSTLGDIRRVSLEDIFGY